MADTLPSSFYLSALFVSFLGCILVTDATAAMGLEPGLHKLGDMTVELADNFRLTLKDSDTLAGSAVTMDATIRNFAAFGVLKQLSR
jgi:N-acetylglucosamine-6-phosphate deacetylase